MAKLVQYADFYPYLITELPGVQTPLLLQELRSAARAFCLDSRIWHEDLDPIAVVDYQQDYTLTQPYDAAIHEILAIKVNGSLQDRTRYKLFDAVQVRFQGNAAPYTQDDQLLVCGVAGELTLSGWQAVTDGSVTFTIDGATYLASAIDFTGAADMADVARRIQDALRAVLAQNEGNVRWVTDHFVAWVKAGTIGVLSAGTSGTDIAGASWMNGLTSVGTLSGRLDVEVLFRPEMTADDLPDWMVDHWGEAIKARTLFQLQKMPGKTWSQPGSAALNLQVYRTEVGMAKGELEREHTDMEYSLGA